jgi:hypothetical protein
MSIDALLRRPEVKEIFDPILPQSQIELGAELVIPPQSKSGSLVGTAFDYLVRFELQRRYPNAVARKWVAEEALDGDRSGRKIHCGCVH